MSNYCDQTSALMDVEQALQWMSQQVRPLEKVECLPLSQALNTVLAEDIIAGMSVPPFANSAMDGYAFKSQDERSQFKLRLVGKALAGHPYQGAALKPGQAVKITTGAVIPEGADTVCMQEYVDTLEDEQCIVIKQASVVGNNIRQSGEDVQAGDLVFAKGRKLRASDLAVLASLGIAQVVVFKAITVAIFSTGDELINPEQHQGELAAGQIFQSNSYVMQAMLQQADYQVLNLGHLLDNPEAIKQALLEAMHKADVIITSGGVSVGEADYLKTVLNDLGEIAFWKLAIKPGKPFAFGHLQQQGQYCQFFALPGNPVSSTVTLHQLVLPILSVMSGQSIQQPLVLSAKAISTFKKRPGRTDYQRGIATMQQGQLCVQAIQGQGSGLMQSLSRANCFVRLQRQRGDVLADEMVDIIMFDHCI